MTTVPVKPSPGQAIPSSTSHGYVATNTGPPKAAQSEHVRVYNCTRTPVACLCVSVCMTAHACPMCASWALPPAWAQPPPHAAHSGLALAVGMLVLVGLALHV